MLLSGPGAAEHPGVVSDGRLTGIAELQSYRKTGAGCQTHKPGIDKCAGLHAVSPARFVRLTAAGSPSSAIETGPAIAKALPFVKVRVCMKRLVAKLKAKPLLAIWNALLMSAAQDCTCVKVAVQLCRHSSRRSPAYTRPHPDRSSHRRWTRHSATPKRWQTRRGNIGLAQSIRRNLFRRCSASPDTAAAY